MIAEEMPAPPSEDEEDFAFTTAPPGSGGDSDVTTEPKAEVEIAVIIDDVINRRPKFLQSQ